MVGYLRKKDEHGRREQMHCQLVENEQDRGAGAIAKNGECGAACEALQHGAKQLLLAEGVVAVS
eukprot:3250874-Pleurochrysis_carterae.AAC.1